MRAVRFLAFFLRHRRGRHNILSSFLAVSVLLYICLCVIIVRDLNVKDEPPIILRINSRNILDANKRRPSGVDVRQLHSSSEDDNSTHVFQSFTFDAPKTRQIMGPAWKQFIDKISVNEMYEYQANYLTDLLYELSTSKIVNVTIFKGGTQVKFLLVFEDGNKAIAKPMRNPRDFYWANNKSEPFYFDPERHTSEIASFHLDRILNYRRVAPCVGRRVSFVNDIVNKTNDEKFLRLLRQQDGNGCFLENCTDYLCVKDRLVCSKNDVMELSVCQKIPGRIYDYPHPWSQAKREKRVWQSKNVCPSLFSQPRMRNTRFFLDIMELALFDYLIVNYDRHHIAMLDYVNKTRTFAAIIDNGKGFPNPFKDDITFLAPIYQCCRFRNSTYQHILSLSKNNNTLGDLMKRSLSQDPLAPILTEPFFHSLDRRLEQFHFVISKCIEAHGASAVFEENITG